MKKIIWLIEILASIDVTVGSSYTNQSPIDKKYNNLIVISYQDKVNLDRICIPKSSKDRSKALEMWNEIYKDVKQDSEKILSCFQQREISLWKLYSGYSEFQNPVLGAVLYKEDDNENPLNHQSGSVTSFIVGIIGKSKKSNNLETWSPTNIIMKYSNNQVKSDNSKLENVRRKPRLSMSDIIKKPHNILRKANSNIERVKEEKFQFSISDSDGESNPKSQSSLCSRWCNACSNLIQRIWGCLFPQRSANSARSEPSYENLP